MTGRYFYTVGVGLVPGIYTNERRAREQINGFSNGQWKRSNTYDEALYTTTALANSVATAFAIGAGVTGSDSCAPTAFVHVCRLPNCVATAFAGDTDSDSPARQSADSTPVAAIPIVASTRHQGQWRVGDTLWGAEGTLLLFEDRYDFVDYIYNFRLSPVRLMETQDRRRLEAFVGRTSFRDNM
ncbi:hypothetical protein B0H14DRAFT_3426214 [Mycena olivaceomarginata]|nr:hypothetical protein B0H14DRAFT_3426214 [Mycena olivaceomarginata]